MNANIRFIELLDKLKELGITKGYVAIAEQLGTNKAAISDIKANRKKISVDLLSSMKSTYPKISLDWIITGEGEMFSTTINQSHNEMANINGDNIKSDKNLTALLNRSFDEITEQRKLTESAQKQIDRLLTIIETLNQK